MSQERNALDRAAIRRQWKRRPTTPADPRDIEVPVPQDVIAVQQRAAQQH